VDTSVERFCNLLARSGLLPPGEVRALRRRWLHEAGPDGSDGARFTRWLVARHYLTAFQAHRLAQGHTHHFFLNHYKILERIAQGRMAGVYKAVHDSGQVVAVKVLPPSRATDPEFLGRFRREARLAWQLHHPNVVRTFQAGESGGLHYLVMEYLEGETLEEVLQRRGRLPAGEALRLAYQALLGLQHLHERGLVHRNLEPANLMLVPARGSLPLATTLDATVKILDISLARAEFDQEQGPDGDELRLTHEGVLLGNVAYLAPEQAVNPHAADIRADVYSLGCILYHCLTGQVPFADTNALRQLIRHATEKPRPLLDFPLEAGIPEGLQQVLDWMMHRDPAQRYPTPDRAAQALRAFLGGGMETPATPKAEAPLEAYLKWLATVPLAEPVNGETGRGQPEGAVAPGRRPFREIVHLSRRDCALLGLGAVGLLAAEGIGWLLGQFFKPRDRPAPPEDAPAQGEQERGRVGLLRPGGTGVRGRGG
jgi:serine/threonine protein kinase